MTAWTVAADLSAVYNAHPSKHKVRDIYNVFTYLGLIISKYFVTTINYVVKNIHTEFTWQFTKFTGMSMSQALLLCIFRLYLGLLQILFMIGTYFTNQKPT